MHKKLKIVAAFGFLCLLSGHAEAEGLMGVSGTFSSPAIEAHAVALQQFGGFIGIDESSDHPVACATEQKAAELKQFVAVGGSFIVDGCYRVDAFSADWIKLLQCSSNAIDVCQFSFVKGDLKRDGWMDVGKVNYLSPVPIKDRVGEKYFDFRCELLSASVRQVDVSGAELSKSDFLEVAWGNSMLPYQKAKWTYLSINTATSDVYFSTISGMVFPSYANIAHVFVGKEPFSRSSVQFQDQNAVEIFPSSFENANAFASDLRFFSVVSFGDAISRFEIAYLSGRGDGWGALEIAFGNNDELFFKPSGKDVATSYELASSSESFRGHCKVHEVPNVVLEPKGEW